MTTKPKARKFRIRRPGEKAGAHSEVAAAPAETMAQAMQPDLAPQTDPVTHAARIADESGIEEIRKEGLTGRQLRMARRVAQKHGLTPTSDFDAVRLLRARGIDPFQRNNMLELVHADGEAKPEAQAAAVPGMAKQTLPNAIETAQQNLPSTETVSPAERRAVEIMRVQQELARRRRKKLALLLTRLGFFVLFPAILAGYYFYAVATPIYSTKAAFLILKAESGGGAGGIGGMLSGTQFATNQDAIAVQSYLTSKDAMIRLDQDVGFKEHYTQSWIDPIQRLTDDPTNEEAYRTYKSNITIGYDPTEGVIRMEIRAADPLVAVQYAEALIGYAEEMVDNLSARKRSNAVSDAVAALEKATQDRARAQERLVRMQQETSIVDPQSRIAALSGQINTYEMQLQEKSLQLQALLDNPSPNQAKVEGARGDIRRLEALLAALNSQMTDATVGENSLADKAVQIQLAQADLATRDMMLQSALERLEQARRDADSQARYLTTSEKPRVPQDAAYPRKFENTILAFLIFGGIYLMVSLTASILREQVSS